jgi:hypothetical protein
MTDAPILARDARLAWARAILDDPEVQSDARMRRACLTILNHSPSSETDERLRAAELLEPLQPSTSTTVKRDGNSPAKASPPANPKGV